MELHILLLNYPPNIQAYLNQITLEAEQYKLFIIKLDIIMPKCIVYIHNIIMKIQYTIAYLNFLIASIITKC